MKNICWNRQFFFYRTTDSFLIIHNFQSQMLQSREISNSVHWKYCTSSIMLNSVHYFLICTFWKLHCSTTTGYKFIIKIAHVPGVNHDMFLLFSKKCKFLYFHGLLSFLFQNWITQYIEKYTKFHVVYINCHCSI